MFWNFRFKKQINCNTRLKKQIALSAIQISKYSYKNENSAQKKTHLNENFVRFGQIYNDRINQLKTDIAKEDEKAQKNREAMKDQSLHGRDIRLFHPTAQGHYRLSQRDILHVIQD